MNPVLPDAPFYRRRRIGSVAILAKTLAVTEGELHRLATRADQMYRLASSVPKPDGSVRQTWDAREPLKSLHRSIRRNILDHVVWPSYLTGSLKGCDYKVNASLHAGARIVISEDITGFFGFSQEVADCLTRLTTRHGALPQGAITSSYLANLAFWDAEPALQAGFRARGMTYSRYVDDISVSSASFLDGPAKTEIVARVYGMLFSRGYQPRRDKHGIRTSDGRMEVTRLSVNVRPGISGTKQSQIRSAVYHTEKAFLRGEITSFSSGQYAETLGQVHLLARFHPGKAEKLLQRMRALRKKAEES